MVVNVILFDDFETMDAFGPVQVFGKAPEHFYIRYLSLHGGIVNSTQNVKVWTEPLGGEEIRDILLIPGGRGAKKQLYLEKELLEAVKQAAQSADLCMMVENGSALLAQTGLLYRRQVADYEFDENWKRMFTAGIHHVPDVRWIADGKYYSCSTTAACLDMSLGIVSDRIDMDVAARIAEQLGYSWDPENEEGILL